MALLENSCDGLWHKLLCGFGMDTSHSPLSKQQQKNCMNLLRKNPMFWGLSDEALLPIVRKMTVEHYPAKEVLMHEGAPTSRFFVVASGNVVRTRTIDQRSHRIDEASGLGTTVGALHALNNDAAYATAYCTTDVIVYVMDGTTFRSHLRESPELHFLITQNLCTAVRDLTKRFRTSLEDIQASPSSITATSLAAVCESFYRSAMNALINRSLTGAQAPLFPDMHIQVPTRVLYINGFKQLRALLDSRFRRTESESSGARLLALPQWEKLGIMCAPGIIMAPISSVLEAANAGHTNPEPMTRRWTRGYTPRVAREVIFGVGINQMSDFFEERMPPWIEGSGVRAALGSVAAGVLCGYLSHVPHNLSAMKLMHPNLSYGTLFSKLVDKSEARLFGQAQTNQVAWRRPAAAVSAVLFPTSVMIRTVQV